MNDATHTCQANGCEAVINASNLMCRRHWFMVPLRLRGEVWRWWRKVCRGDGFDTVQRYREVRRQAIAAVNEKERQHGPA